MADETREEEEEEEALSDFPSDFSSFQREKGKACLKKGICREKEGWRFQWQEPHIAGAQASRPARKANAANCVFRLGFACRETQFSLLSAHGSLT